MEEKNLYQTMNIATEGKGYLLQMLTELLRKTNAGLEIGAKFDKEGIAIHSTLDPNKKGVQSLLSLSYLSASVEVMLESMRKNSADPNGIRAYKEIIDLLHDFLNEGDFVLDDERVQTMLDTPNKVDVETHIESEEVPKSILDQFFGEQ